MPLAQLGLAIGPLAILLAMAWLGFTVGSFLAALYAVARGARARRRGESGRWARRLGLGAASLNLIVFAACVRAMGKEPPPDFIEVPALVIGALGLLGAALGLAAIPREAGGPGRLWSAVGVVLFVLVAAGFAVTERRAHMLRWQEKVRHSAGSNDDGTVEQALDGLSAADRDALLIEACTSWRGPSPKVVELLLEAGVSVNARGRGGDPVWRSAVFQADPRTVDLFLAHGADPNAVWSGGSTPARVAWFADNASLLARLRRAGARDADLHEARFQALANAGRAGDVKTFQALRAEGVPDWHQGPLGEAVFEAAGEGGHVEVLRLLVAGRDYKCAAAERALVAAARNDKEEAFVFLLRSCANPGAGLRAIEGQPWHEKFARLAEARSSR